MKGNAITPERDSEESETYERYLEKKVQRLELRVAELEGERDSARQAAEFWRQAAVRLGRAMPAPEHLARVADFLRLHHPDVCPLDEGTMLHHSVRAWATTIQGAMNAGG